MSTKRHFNKIFKLKIFVANFKKIPFVFPFICEQHKFVQFWIEFNTINSKLYVKSYRVYCQFRSMSSFLMWFSFVHPLVFLIKSSPHSVFLAAFFFSLVPVFYCHKTKQALPSFCKISFLSSFIFKSFMNSAKHYFF